MKYLIKLILIFLFLITSACGQILFFEEGDYYTFDAITGTNGTVGDYHIITGTMPRTKTVSDSGSMRAQPYMRLWTETHDSVDCIFDADDRGFEGTTAHWNLRSASDTVEISTYTAYTGSKSLKIARYNDDASATIEESDTTFQIILGTPYEFGFWYKGTTAPAFTVKIVHEDQYAEDTGGWIAITDTNWHYYSFEFTRVSTEWDYSPTYLQVQQSSGTLYIDDVFLIRDTIEIDSTAGLVWGVPNIQEDRPYFYDCVGVPAGGNAVYSNGEDSTFTIPLSPPEGLELSIINNVFDLSWYSPNTVADSALIERSLNDTDYVQIAGINGSVSSYTDNTINYGTTYYYRVRLKRNNYSAYSNTASGAVVSEYLTFDYDPLDWGDIDSTAAVSGETGGIVVIDAETGDLSQFTTTNIDAGNGIAVATDTVNNGTYSFKFSFGGTGEVNQAEYDITENDSVSARVYVYIPADYDFGGKNSTAYRLLLYDGGLVIARLGMRYGNPSTNWIAWQLRGDGIATTDYSAAHLEKGQWHQIEVFWVQGTGADGICKVWIDETLAIDISNHTNSTGLVDMIQIGNNAGANPASGEYLYFDDLKIDYAVIGSYSGGAGGSSDSTLTLTATNNNAGIVIIDSISTFTAPFSLETYHTFPDTMAVADTSQYKITLDYGYNTGLYQQFPTWYLLSGVTQNVEITANILIGAVPDTVTGLDTTSMTTTVANLIWNDVDNETGYKVDLKTDGTAWGQDGATVAGDTTYQATGLSPNTNYTFRVKSYNGNGDGVASDTLRTVTRSEGSVPAQVTGLDTVTVNTTSIDLTWTNVADETGYKVERKLGSEAVGSFTQIGTTLVDDITYTAVNLADETTYTFRVRAYNGTGNGTYSDTLRVTTDPIPQTLTDVYLTTAAAIDMDDICFWLHPSSNDSSTIIASDKTASKIFVFDLTGNLLQTVTPPGKPGNIDIRYEFYLSGVPTDIVAVNDRDNDDILFYSVNSTTRQLTLSSSVSITGDMDSPNYGLTMYKSLAYDSSYYVFVSDYQGDVAQYKLEDNAGAVGLVGSAPVRTWETGANGVSDIAEGMVADDETGKLYVGRENYEVAVYAAEPDSATTKQTTFATVGTNGVVADIEGLALYYNSGGNGYIAISNQGASNYKFYTRELPHTFVSTAVVDSSVDGDGLDINNANFGAVFPYGIFAVHDGADRIILRDYSTLGLDINTAYWNPRTGAVPVSDSSFTFSTPYVFTTTDSGNTTQVANIPFINNSGVTLEISSMTGLSSPFSVATLTDSTIVNGDTALVQITASHGVNFGTYIDTLVVTAVTSQSLVVRVTITDPTPSASCDIRVANYYIDGTDGNDSNNGLTPATAFKTLDKIHAIGSAVAGKTIAIRDSIFYRRTTDNSNVIRISHDNVRFTNWYPCSEQLPKIRGSIDISTWTPEGTPNVWQASGMNSSNTIVLEYPNLDSLRWGLVRSGIGSLAAEGDFYVSGSTVYLYAPSDPDTRYASVHAARQTYSIVRIDGQNAQIDHLNLAVTLGTGVRWIYGGDGGVMRDCYLGYTGSSTGQLAGKDGDGIAANSSNVKIINNIVYDTGHHALRTYVYSGETISNVTFDSNTVVNTHYYFFDFNTQSTGNLSGVKVRWNIMYDNPWEEYLNEPTLKQNAGALWTNANVADLEFAYNLIYDIRDGPVIQMQVGACSIYNNTMIQSRATAPLVISNGGSGSVFKNNIMITASGGNLGTLPSGSSNNVTGTSYSSFVDFSVGDFSRRNFHLSSGSAIDGGTVLGYTKDLDGNPVPVGSAPDVGCYEKQ